MKKQTIFSTLLFSAVISVPLATAPINDADAADRKVKECKPDFEYSLVFKRCIRDYAGGPRSS